MSNVVVQSPTTADWTRKPENWLRWSTSWPTQAEYTEWQSTLEKEQYRGGYSDELA